MIVAVYVRWLCTRGGCVREAAAIDKKRAARPLLWRGGDNVSYSHPDLDPTQDPAYERLTMRDLTVYQLVNRTRSCAQVLNDNIFTFGTPDIFNLTQYNSSWRPDAIDTQSYKVRFTSNSHVRTPCAHAADFPEPLQHAACCS